MDSTNGFEMIRTEDGEDFDWILLARRRLSQHGFNRLMGASLGEIPILIIDFLLTAPSPFVGAAFLQEIENRWVTLADQGRWNPTPPTLSDAEFVWQEESRTLCLLNTTENQYLLILTLAELDHPLTDAGIDFLRNFSEVAANLFNAKQKAQKKQRQLSDANKAEARLRRELNAKDSFLATISHELRTPLNAIIGNTELMKDGVFGAVVPSQLRALATISDSSEHLLALIDDVLDLAKIQAKAEQIELSRIYIDEVCQAALRFVQVRARRKQIALSCHIAPELKKMYADERRLKQVLLNLLSNAIKFTPRNGDVFLEVTLHQSQKWVEFVVRDTGKGIAPQDIERLFKPFEQIDARASDNEEGTGLGLALVKRIAQAHGGDAWVESEINVGSRFIVSFPYDSDNIPDTSGIAQYIPPTRPLSDEALPAFDMTTGAKLTSAPAADAPIALVAEDHKDSIEMIQTFLEMVGFRVKTARNGFEAIHSALETPPDLILMDIQMPAMDGFEAAKRLRILPQFAKTPIIAITALVSPGDKERILKAGFDDHLSKPFQYDDFSAKLETYLQPEQN